MDSIRVVIIDDMVEINDYFRILLSRENDIEVLGMATNSQEGFELVERVQPDIVLTDIEMERPEAGIILIRKLKPLFPDIKYIVLTIHEEDDILFKSFEAGADDFIVKTASASEILQSIRRVYENNPMISSNIFKKIIHEFCRMKSLQDEMKDTLNMAMQLTRTEYEILKDMYFGKSYKQIAAARMVEEVTIRTQGSNIIKKFKKNRIKEVVEELRKMKFFDIYD